MGCPSRTYQRYIRICFPWTLKQMEPIGKFNDYAWDLDHGYLCLSEFFQYNDKLDKTHPYSDHYGFQGYLFA